MISSTRGAAERGRMNMRQGTKRLATSGKTYIYFSNAWIIPYDNPLFSGVPDGGGGNLREGSAVRYKMDQGKEWIPYSLADLPFQNVRMCSLTPFSFKRITR